MENTHISRCGYSCQYEPSVKNSCVVVVVVIFFFFFFSISKFLALLRCFGRGLTAPGTDEQALQISNQQEKDKERGGKEGGKTAEG